MQAKEIESEIREGLKQAREDIDFFTQLLDTQGWKRLKAIAEVQRETRLHFLLQNTEIALQSQGKSSDYEKGMLQGIQIFLGLPELAIGHAKETLKHHNEVGQDEYSEDA